MGMPFTIQSSSCVPKPCTWDSMHNVTILKSLSLALLLPSLDILFRNETLLRRCRMALEVIAAWNVVNQVFSSLGRRCLRTPVLIYLGRGHQMRWQNGRQRKGECRPRKQTWHPESAPPPLNVFLRCLERNLCFSKRQAENKNENNLNSQPLWSSNTMKCAG